MQFRLCIQCDAIGDEFVILLTHSALFVNGSHSLAWA